MPGLNGLPSRFHRSLLVATAAAALLTGCATGDPATTGSISRESGFTISQAEKLRAAGRAGEAVRMLAPVAAKNPKSRPVMLAYAKALADSGQDEQALVAFGQALDPKRPDWRIVNAEGALLDRLGRTIDAQTRYQAALGIAPEEPAILTNLGLSLALSEKPAEGEAMLRRAVAHPRATAKMRQNLALVLALQGKYGEAEQLARRDLPADQAAANVRYWKENLKPRATAETPPAPPKPAAKAAAKPKPAAPPPPPAAPAETAPAAAAPPPAPVPAAAPASEEPLGLRI